MKRKRKQRKLEAERALKSIGESGERAAVRLFDVEDEYDPANPNNYELYLEERMRKEEEDRERKDLQQQLEEQEQKVTSLSFPEDVVAHLSLIVKCRGKNLKGRERLKH